MSKRQPKAVCEVIEPRLLMATFDYQSVAGLLDIPSVIRDIQAPAGSSNFGMHAESVGDVDGDGVADFVISAPGHEDIAGDAGVAGSLFLYSGATFGVLASASDGEVDFGAAFGIVRDENGDGVADLAVGSPRNGAGKVSILSARDLSLIRTLESPGAVKFGRSLASRPDLSWSSLLVGAEGLVYWVPLTAGGTVSSIQPPRGQEHHAFGSSVAAVAGVTVIGAAGSPFAGVYVHDSHLSQPMTGYSPGFSGTIRSGGSAVVWRSEENGESVEYVLGGQIATLHRSVVDSPLGADYAFDSALKANNWRVSVSRLGNGSFVASLSYFWRVDISELFTFRDAGEFKIESALDGPLSWIGDVSADGADDIISAHPTNQGGTVRILSPLPALLSQHVYLRGARQDGRVVWGDGALPNDRFPSPTAPPFFVVDGKPVLMSSMQNFGAGWSVIDVAPDARTWVLNTDSSAYAVYRSGAATPVIDLVKRVRGQPANLNALVPVGISADGRIAFRAPRADTGAAAAWLLETDGTLSYLWDGTVNDISDAGVVVGSSNGWGAVRGSADGVITVIHGMDIAHAINESGVIAGERQGNAVIFWNGQSISIGRPSSLANNVRGFRLTAVDDRGHAVGHLLQGTAPNPEPGEGFYATIAGVLGRLNALQQGVPGTDPVSTLSWNKRTFGFAHDGRLTINIGALEPIFDSDLVRARLGELISIDSSAGGIRFATIGADGHLVVYSQSTGFPAWTASGALTGGTATDSRGQIVVWTDHADGKPYALYVGFVGGEPTLRLYSLETSPILLVEPFEGPTRAMTALRDEGGRLVLAGYGADGSLVMAERTDALAGTPGAWRFVNVSTEHLALQSIATPEWVSRPSAFTTIWGAMNIVGLDADGQAMAVWKAPGMRLWRADNLTASAGGPKLAGGLTTFVTDWNSMNVIGTDEAGDTVALWWVPGIGDSWVVSNLSENAGASRRLQPGTVTSFVTAWGGLNVVGIADEGAVVALWWAPGMNTWVESELSAAAPIGQPRFAGPLTAAWTAVGTSVIAGVMSNGDVAGLFWAPGSSWIFDDLTASL